MAGGRILPHVTYMDVCRPTGYGSFGTATIHFGLQYGFTFLRKQVGRI